VGFGRVPFPLPLLFPPSFLLVLIFSRGCGSVPFDSIGFARLQANFFSSSTRPCLVYLGLGADRSTKSVLVVVDADFWRSSIDQRLLSLLVARRFPP
jgi:hypothetical protein